MPDQTICPSQVMSFLCDWPMFVSGEHKEIVPSQLCSRLRRFSACNYKWWTEFFSNRSDLKSLQKEAALGEVQTFRITGSEKPPHFAKLSYSSLKSSYSFQNRSWWDSPKSGLGMMKPMCGISSVHLHTACQGVWVYRETRKSVTTHPTQTALPSPPKPEYFSASVQFRFFTEF